MNFKPQNHSRGSLTVEAVLVIPIIIFVLFWLVNIAFVLYQYAALQSYANQAVEAAQAGWDNTSKDIRTGRLENSKQLNDAWLYWNVIDKDKSVKETSLKSWIYKQLKEDPLMELFTKETSTGAVTVTVSQKSLLCLRRSIEVRITDNRKTLFSPLRNMFGLDMTNEVTVVSTGTLEDPAELIRNLDWGVDLYSGYMKENPNSKVADVARKIEEIKEKCINLLN